MKVSPARIGIAFLLAVPVFAQLDANPPASEAVGINIHFTSPRPGELPLLADSGAHWVRVDFTWERMEKAPGEYDFGVYDRLMVMLEPFHIRVLAILDYSNPLYDEGLSPHTDKGREAFAKWAAATVNHFRGRGIVWEMYNEPNRAASWRPHPDVHDYILLAQTVGEAIQKSAPGEILAGPGVAEFDYEFLNACLDAGLLKYWSAVSIHPYRQLPPETVAEDYRQLRELIAANAPPGKQVPIISSEWGYSTIWKGVSEDTQAKLLPREWLINLANHVAVSIWYDWRDNQIDPKLAGAHFGVLALPYRYPQEPAYRQKPAFFAMRTFTALLDGFRFDRRLDVGDSSDYVLAFAKGPERRVVAWSTSPIAHRLAIPVSANRYQVFGNTGQKLEPLSAEAGLIELNLTDAPLYLIPAPSK